MAIFILLQSNEDENGFEAENSALLLLNNILLLHVFK